MSLQLVCVSSQNAVRQSVGGGRTAGFWCLLNTMQLSKLFLEYTHSSGAFKIRLYETKEHLTVQKTACLGILVLLLIYNYMV